MKKMLTLILSLLLLFVTTIPAAVAEEYPPMKLQWAGYGSVPADDDPVKLLLEDKFNVTFEMIATPDADLSAYNLLLSSEPDFDVLAISVGSGQGREVFNTLIDQEMIRSFPIEWLEEYMPTWMAKIKAMTGLTMEEIETQISRDGKVYGLPCVTWMVCMPYGEAIRQDWLDNLNLEMPHDLESYIEVIRAFTFNDPDGNGVNDTYGLNGGHWSSYNFLLGCFGIVRGAYWVQEDGSVIYTNATENYKEALKCLQTLYTDGTIDPESLTDDRAKQRDKWANGIVGICQDALPNMMFGIPDSVIKNNAAAKWSYIPALENGGAYTDWVDLMDSMAACAFGYNATDEEVIRIMQIKEYIAANPEVKNLADFGVKDVDWTLDENGVAKSLGTGYIGSGYFFAYYPFTAAEDLTILPGFEAAEEVAVNVKRLYSGQNFILSTPCEARNWYGADVSTIANEYYTKAIQGNINIDETWDAYVKSLNDAGLDKILAEYEELLK